jgi:hypothetical protein
VSAIQQDVPLGTDMQCTAALAYCPDRMHTASQGSSPVYPNRNEARAPLLSLHPAVV